MSQSGEIIAIQAENPVANHNTFRFILALLAAFGALLIGEQVYLKEFLTTDENSYLFQAWLFLNGEMSLECPVGLSDTFFHRMIICDEQAGWHSRYPPAHAVWLMPGVAVDYPRLMTAVAAFLSVWFLTRAGERLQIPVWMTGGLLMASPYFWLMQGSVLSHTSALAATALMVWAYLAWLQDRKLLFASIAGLAWAFLFLNRSYTALWIALPFAVDALVRLARTRTWPQFAGTVAFSACASLGLAGYFVYNALLTGDPFFPTFLQYNSLDGPGFGIRHAPDHTHTPEIGWEFIKSNLETLNIRLWGFPGSLYAWLGLALIGLRLAITPLLVMATVLVWLAYGAFWFPGIDELAPIYYYETLIFIVLTAAMGLHRLYTFDWRLPRWAPMMAMCACVVVVAMYSAKIFQLGAIDIIKRHQVKSSVQQVIKGVPPNSIVLISGLHKDLIDETSWNPRGLESDPIILRSLHENERVIAHMFPDRRLYMVNGKGPDRGSAQLIQNLDDEVPQIPATSMSATTGVTIETSDGHEYVAESSSHSKGMLGYGKRHFLVPGTYEIRFFLEVSGREPVPVGRVEVLDVSGKKVMAERELYPGDNDVVMKVESGGVRLVEPRVHYHGNGKLVFNRIELHHEPHSEEG